MTLEQSIEVLNEEIKENKSELKSLDNLTKTHAINQVIKKYNLIIEAMETAVQAMMRLNSESTVIGGVKVV